MLPDLSMISSRVARYLASFLVWGPVLYSVWLFGGPGLLQKIVNFGSVAVSIFCVILPYPLLNRSTMVGCSQAEQWVAWVQTSPQAAVP